MCSNCIAYSVFGALALVLLVSGIGQQLKMPEIGLDMATGIMALQYFSGIALMGAAKYYKAQAHCMGMESESKKRKKR